MEQNQHNRASILATEYSEQFDETRKGLMYQSHFKYGWVRDMYGLGAEKPADAVACVRRYLAKYEETGNMEFLADAANFCMIEFMYPSRTDAFFKYTESGESPNVIGKNGQVWR